MEKKSNQIFNITKGVIISLISTMTFLVIFSAILTYTNVQEETINPVILIIISISILIGSSIGNMKIKHRGMINGAFIGLLYMIIMHLISSLITGQFGLNIQSIIYIFGGIIFGIFGGIIGVNKK